MEVRENSKVRKPVIFHCSRSIVTAIKSKWMRWRGMCYARGRREMYTEFWLGNLKDSDCMEDLGVDQARTTRKTERTILIQRKKLQDTGVDSWGNDLLTFFKCNKTN
jgi:DNA-binding SARP family transcriptional activator